MTQWNKYERTAARKHGKSGRDARPKSTTIDIHSHDCGGSGVMKMQQRPGAAVPAPLPHLRGEPTAARTHTGL